MKSMMTGKAEWVEVRALCKLPRPFLRMAQTVKPTDATTFCAGCSAKRLRVMGSFDMRPGTMGCCPVVPGGFLKNLTKRIGV